MLFVQYYNGQRSNDWDHFEFCAIDWGKFRSNKELLVNAPVEAHLLSYITLIPALIIHNICYEVWDEITYFSGCTIGVW